LNGKEVVGPGSYELGFKNNHHLDAPKWTMRAKTDGAGTRDANPGPGTYENYDKTKLAGSNFINKLPCTL
jgi:hypothetical protein